MKFLQGTAEQIIHRLANPQSYAVGNGGGGEPTSSEENTNQDELELAKKPVSAWNRSKSMLELLSASRDLTNEQLQGPDVAWPDVRATPWGQAVVEQHGFDDNTPESKTLETQCKVFWRRGRKQKPLRDTAALILQGDERALALVRMGFGMARGSMVTSEAFPSYDIDAGPDDVHGGGAGGGALPPPPPPPPPPPLEGGGEAGLGALSIGTGNNNVQGGEGGGGGDGAGGAPGLVGGGGSVGGGGAGLDALNIGGGSNSVEGGGGAPSRNFGGGGSVGGGDGARDDTNFLGDGDDVPTFVDDEDYNDFEGGHETCPSLCGNAARADPPPRSQSQRRGQPLRRQPELCTTRRPMQPQSATANRYDRTFATDGGASSPLPTTGRNSNHFFPGTLEAQTPVQAHTNNGYLAKTQKVSNVPPSNIVVPRDNYQVTRNNANDDEALPSTRSLGSFGSRDSRVSQFSILTETTAIAEGSIKAIMAVGNMHRQHASEEADKERDHDDKKQNRVLKLQQKQMDHEENMADKENERLGLLIQLRNARVSVDGATAFGNKVARPAIEEIKIGKEPATEEPDAEEKGYRSPPGAALSACIRKYNDAPFAALAEEAERAEKERTEDPAAKETRKDDSVDDVEETEEEPGTKGNVACGLVNMGNTCYLSSSLQTVLSVPGFIQDLQATVDTIEMRHQDQGSTATIRLAQSLLEIANEMRMLPKAERGDNQRVASPKAVKHAIDELSEKFQGSEQHDAHEFIVDLIDILHDELKAAVKALNADENEEHVNESGQHALIVLPTDKYFLLEAVETLTCEECKYSRNKKVVYRQLSVQVGDEDEAPWTVERAMDDFFTPEKLELKCEKCPCAAAQKELRISKKPTALIVHFKRFLVKISAAAPAAAAKPADKENAKSNLVDESEDCPPLLEDPEPEPEASAAPPVGISFHKNKTCVVLQRSITLDRFCKNDEMITSGPNSYAAKAVIHHIGSEADTGHYTASAVRAIDMGLFNKDVGISDGEEKWVKFDDRFATFTDEGIVLNEKRSQHDAYMALYAMEAKTEETKAEPKIEIEADKEEEEEEETNGETELGAEPAAEDVVDAESEDGEEEARKKKSKEDFQKVLARGRKAENESFARFQLAKERSAKRIAEEKKSQRIAATVSVAISAVALACFYAGFHSTGDVSVSTFGTIGSHATSVFHAACDGICSAIKLIFSTIVNFLSPVNDFIYQVNRL